MEVFMNKNKHKLITLGILTAFATGIIYVINHLIFASAILKDILNSKENYHYKWRFGNIYYTKHGTGRPILLIHDLTYCSSGYEWSKLVHSLEKEYTVYVMDLLGCGRSDKPRITYTNYLYVQLLSDFIINVIGERTDIIASGYSSSFAVMACKNNDQLFGKLMLINPPLISSLNKAPDKKTKFYKFILELPVFGTLIYNMIASKENVELLFTEEYYHNPFHVDPDIADAYYESAHLGGSDAKYLLSSLIGCYINNNIYPALKSIQQDIYIVASKNEKNVTDILNQYTAANPSIETTVINHCKHLPQLETPEAILEQIQKYF
jgi:pimeloyl-ACP methyl ester carboxylesterase